MTAKEGLHERIEHLSDEEAQELLGRLEWESTEDEELAPEEGELVRASRAEYERGDVVDGEKLFRSWVFNHLSADALPRAERYIRRLEKPPRSRAAIRFRARAPVPPCAKSRPR